MQHPMLPCKQRGSIAVARVYSSVQLLTFIALGLPEVQASNCSADSPTYVYKDAVSRSQ